MAESNNTSPATDIRPAPHPRPRPVPVERPRISPERFQALLAHIEASPLDEEGKKDLIRLVSALYGFKV